MCGVLIGILLLTGCATGNRSNRSGRRNNNSNNGLEAVEFNADEFFVRSNLGNMTNQEAFDLMIQNPGAIFTFLNLIDDIILRDNFDIDYDEIDEFWEEFKIGIPDLNEWMMQGGFTSEEEVIHVLQLEELREEAARHLVNVTDEEVEEVFEMWFDPETDDLEERRDEIYEALVGDAVRDVSVQEVARLRYEADFVIFNDALERAYDDFLEMWVTNVGTHDGEASSEDVIARVDGVDITIGQVFDVLSSQIGLETAFDQFDEIIIAANFSVDPSEINEMIAEYRVEFGEDFYDVLAGSGFDSEDDLFDFLERNQLEEMMLNEHLAPSEERLREMYEAMGDTVSGSHILVEDYEMAVDLIQQLRDVQSNFPEAFADLAAEHSLCPSGANGGDLGRWQRGSMVEEFDNVIFELGVGQFTSAPVATEHGFHIIFKTGANPDFEEVRDELIAQEMAHLQQMPGLFDDLMMNFRQEAGIQFTNTALQDRFNYLLNAGSGDQQGGDDQFQQDDQNGDQYQQDDQGDEYQQDDQDENEDDE